jgi:hypothetical protein
MRKQLASRLSARFLHYPVQANHNAPTEIDGGGLHEHHQPDEHIHDPYQRPQSGDDDLSDSLTNATTQDTPQPQSRF